MNIEVPIEFLEDLLDALANYRALQRKDKDVIGAQITSENIGLLKGLLVVDERVES